MSSSTKSIEIPFLEMGGGFLLGLSVGFALKKSFRALLLIVGLGFVFMILLEHQGSVSIDQVPLQEVMDIGGEKVKSVFELLQLKFEKYHIEGGVSALAGFIVGLKIS